MVSLVTGGILLAVAVAIFKLTPLALKPVEIFFLLVAGAGFAYVASRQPRQGGEPV